MLKTVVRMLSRNLDFWYLMCNYGRIPEWPPPQLNISVLPTCSPLEKFKNLWLTTVQFENHCFRMNKCGE